MRKYDLSDTVDLRDYQRLSQDVIRHYLENCDCPLSEVDDQAVQEGFDPSLVSDPETGKSLFMSEWHNLRDEIMRVAAPQPCQIMVLPLTYDSHVIDDNGGEPDGDGEWMVPLERFADDEEFQAALEAGGRLVDGWRVRYNRPAYALEVCGRWSGFQGAGEAYTDSLSVAQQIADWCYR